MYHRTGLNHTFARWCLDLGALWDFSTLLIDKMIWGGTWSLKFCIKLPNSTIPTCHMDIMITEHGVAGGNTPDVRRVGFLRDSLIGLAVSTNAEHVPITSYYHWGLVDTFECSLGYAPHFGLYYIDLPHNRTRRIIGRLYQEVVESRRIYRSKESKLLCLRSFTSF